MEPDGGGNGPQIRSRSEGIVLTGEDHRGRPDPSQVGTAAATGVVVQAIPEARGLGRVDFVEVPQGGSGREGAASQLLCQTAQALHEAEVVDAIETLAESPGGRLQIAGRIDRDGQIGAAPDAGPGPPGAGACWRRWKSPRRDGDAQASAPSPRPGPPPDPRWPRCGRSAGPCPCPPPNPGGSPPPRSIPGPGPGRRYAACSPRRRCPPARGRGRAPSTPAPPRYAEPADRRPPETGSRPARAIPASAKESGGPGSSGHGASGPSGAAQRVPARSSLPAPSVLFSQAQAVQHPGGKGLVEVLQGLGPMVEAWHQGHHQCSRIINP